MSLNKACFIGNLGKDARIAKVGDKDVANFSIAVNEKRGGEETTTWIECALWGGLVPKIGQFLTKGKQVYVEGPISLDERTDNTTGQVYRNLKVLVNDIKLLGGGSGDSRPQRQEQPKADPTVKNPFG